MKTGKSGNRLVEILHIDTEDAQRFFADYHATAAEKIDCQMVLEETFVRCCRAYGGRVRKPTEGDGGIAYFDAATFNGGAIRAAEKFIAELPRLHERTKRLLPGRKVRHRHFRIKAHFGSAYFDKSQKLATSSPDVIDSLVKHEKEIAPLSDQLYITEELLTTLEPKLKARFVPATRRRRFGKLTTIVYRLKKRQGDDSSKTRELKNTKDTDSTHDAVTSGGLGNGRPPRGTLIRNRDQVIRTSAAIITALQEALDYDPKIHHNQIPPDLWRDNPEYIATLRQIVEELKELNDLLRKQSSAQRERKSVVHLGVHIDQFLTGFSSVAGRGAGWLLIASLGGLLYQTGLVPDLAANVLKHIRLR